jgi:hypothetical protein
MRRAITVVVLLALMGGFGFGVNRLIASRKAKIPTEATVYIPTATRPSIVLPGTMYLAQHERPVDGARDCSGHAGHRRSAPRAGILQPVSDQQ